MHYGYPFLVRLAASNIMNPVCECVREYVRDRERVYVRVCVRVCNNRKSSSLRALLLALPLHVLHSRSASHTAIASIVIYASLAALFLCGQASTQWCSTHTRRHSLSHAFLLLYVFVFLGLALLRKLLSDSKDRQTVHFGTERDRENGVRKAGC